MAPTQDNRLGDHTPLGKDVLLLESFSGTEGVSELFRFEVRLALGDRPGHRLRRHRRASGHGAGVHAGRTILQRPGQPVLEGRSDTTFCDLSRRGRAVAVDADADGRLPDLPGQVGAGHHQADVQGSRLHRLRAASHRELPAARVLRPVPRDRLQLRHAADGGGGHLLLTSSTRTAKHTLVLADTPARSPTCSPTGAVRLSDPAARSPRTSSRTVPQEQTIRPGKYALTDYNFEMPQRQPRASRSAACVGAAEQARDLRLSRASTRKRADGERAGATSGSRKRRRGASARRRRERDAGFTPGYKFDLSSHPRQDLNRHVRADRGATSAGSQATGVTAATRRGRAYAEQLHVHPGRGARSGRRARTPRPVIAGRRRPPWSWAVGRGDLHRQVRPREGAVPLGPRRQEGREQLVLDSRVAALGRQGLGLRCRSRASARR